MAEQKDVYSWTKAPNEPPFFSDWTVTFERPRGESGTALTATYAVHRIILAEYSGYFATIFQSALNAGASFSESKDQHSRIVLSGALSDKAFGWTTRAFEMILEICYRKDPNVKIFTLDDSDMGELPIVVPLLYFCDYLQIRNTAIPAKDIMEKAVVRELYRYVLDDYNGNPHIPWQDAFGHMYSAVVELRVGGIRAEKVEAMIVEDALNCADRWRVELCLTIVSVTEGKGPFTGFDRYMLRTKFENMECTRSEY